MLVTLTISNYIAHDANQYANNGSCHLSPFACLRGFCKSRPHFGHHRSTPVPQHSVHLSSSPSSYQRGSSYSCISIQPSSQPIAVHRLECVGECPQLGHSSSSN